MNIAFVVEVDVLHELGEVCGKGVENRLSLGRGGHCEWASPVENVGLTRRVKHRTATEKYGMCLSPEHYRRPTGEQRRENSNKCGILRREGVQPGHSVSATTVDGELEMSGRGHRRRTR